MSEPVTREPSVFPVPEAETVPYDCNPGIPEAMFDRGAEPMSDPVEPPEVVLWNKAAAVQDEELLFYAGQALAAALVAALRYRYAAEKQVSWSIGACRDQEERANAAEAELVRLREALHEVGERTDYIAGEMDDCERGDLERDLSAIDVIVNRALAATEEPNP